MTRLLTSKDFHSLLIGACTAQRVHSPEIRPSSPDCLGTSRHGLDKVSGYSKIRSDGDLIQNIHGRPITKETRIEHMPCTGNDDSFAKRQAAPPILTVFSTTTIWTTVTEGAPSTTSTVNTTIAVTVTATQLSATTATEVYTVTSSITALPSPQKRLPALIGDPTAPAIAVAQADNAAAPTVPSGRDVDPVENAVPADWKRQGATTVTSVITVVARTVVSAPGTAIVTNTVQRTSTVLVRPGATTTASITTTIFVGLGSTTVLPTLTPSSPTVSTPAPDASRTANADPMARTIAGVAIGVALVALALVLGTILFLVRRRRRRHQNPGDSTLSFEAYDATRPTGSVRAANHRPTSPLEPLSIGVSLPMTESRNASREIGHRQEESSRLSTIRLVPNQAETLEEVTSRIQLMPADRPRLEEVMEESSHSDRSSTSSDGTTRLILRPLVSNIRRLEAVLAEQEEPPIAAPREWRSSAWPLPDEPISHRLGRSTSGKFSLSSGASTAARRYHGPQSSSSSSDPWRSLAPSRSGGKNTTELQTPPQHGDAATTTAAKFEGVIIAGGGDKQVENVRHVQLPSPVASSNVFGMARIDSALDWRLKTEAELRQESQARMYPLRCSVWVVNEEEQDRVDRDETESPSPRGVAL